MLTLALIAVVVAAAEPERVIAARARHEEALMEKVEGLGLPWPPRELHLRAFKAERELEVWVGDGRGPLRLLEVFAVCGDSGVLGPKGQQGDAQIPEGFYLVTGLNPWSPGLLSLQLDYPNEADRRRRAVRARTSKQWPLLGGDIAIHGTCISLGCLAIDDQPIEQLYLLALEPRRVGRSIRVHVFPGRLEPERMQALLEATDDLFVVALWSSMIPAYHAFQRTQRAPRTWARSDGSYGVAAR